MNPSPIKHVLTPADILYDLNTTRIGRNVLVFDELDSTNTFALDHFAPAGRAADGTVVFAEFQSTGRGRMGRKWHSPRGASLMFTALLIDDPAAWPTERLVESAAAAVVEAVRETAGVIARIHPPNDVYVAQRKLAGILIETRPLPDGLQAIAIGIGLNCLQTPAHFPEELRVRATSLEIESPNPVDRRSVARSVLCRLDQRFPLAPYPSL